MVRIFHDFGQELEPLKQLVCAFLSIFGWCTCSTLGRNTELLMSERWPKKRYTVYKCCTSPSNLVLAILCDLFGMVK